MEEAVVRRGISSCFTHFGQTTEGGLGVESRKAKVPVGVGANDATHSRTPESSTRNRVYVYEKKQKHVISHKDRLGPGSTSDDSSVSGGGGLSGAGPGGGTEIVRVSDMSKIPHLLEGRINDYRDHGRPGTGPTSLWFAVGGGHNKTYFRVFG